MGREPLPRVGSLFIRMVSLASWLEDLNSVEYGVAQKWRHAISDNFWLPFLHRHAFFLWPKYYCHKSLDISHLRPWRHLWTAPMTFSLHAGTIFLLCFIMSNSSAFLRDSRHTLFLRLILCTRFKPYHLQNYKKYFQQL